MVPGDRETAGAREQNVQPGHGLWQLEGRVAQQDPQLGLVQEETGNSAPAPCHLPGPRARRLSCLWTGAFPHETNMNHSV